MEKKKQQQVKPKEKNMGKMMKVHINNDLEQKQAYHRVMCFKGVAGGISDQSYMSLDHKASCKGDSNQCLQGRTMVHKAVSSEVFH